MSSSNPENAGLPSADPTVAAAIPAKESAKPETVSAANNVSLLPAESKTELDPTLGPPPVGEKTLPEWHQTIDTHQDAHEKQSKHGLGRFWQDVKDRMGRGVEIMRQKTPAPVINNGSRIHFGLKAVADGWSIIGSLRKGSRSIPRLIANIPTFLTLVPGVIYKEEPVSKEEQASYDKMSAMEYVGTKVKQATDPKHHIVELVALATIWNGLFTALSGVRQSTFKGVTLKNWTGKISSEIWQGALTVVAGSILDFTKDREKAFQLSTSVFLWRIPFKAHQAYTAYYKGYPEKNVAAGDVSQFGNFALQQTANFFAMFFGGVKKTDDGKIIVLGKDEDTVDLSKEHIKGYEFDQSGRDRRQTTRSDRVLVLADGKPASGETPAAEPAQEKSFAANLAAAPETKNPESLKNENRRTSTPAANFTDRPRNAAGREATSESTAAMGA